MLTGQCEGLGEESVFVYTIDGVLLTLPHRASALQYRRRPHGVLCIISTRRCLRLLVLTASLSSANARSTDHTLSIYALHVDDHLCAGSSLCLPSSVGEGTSRRLGKKIKKCCVFCRLFKGGTLHRTLSSSPLPPFTTSMPLYT